MVAFGVGIISGRRACLSLFILLEHEQFHDYGVMYKHYIYADCSYLCTTFVDKKMK
jgi:hypothetical protein